MEYFCGIDVSLEQSSLCVVDAKGRITVSGTTASPTFPTTPGVYGPKFFGGSHTSNYTAGDAFVSKLDPSLSGTKQLLLSTFIGGAGRDQGLQLDLDSDGVITVVGWTQTSSNIFPTTPGAPSTIRACAW